MGTNLWITLALLPGLLTSTAPALRGGTGAGFLHGFLHTLPADLVVIEPDASDPELTRVTVDSYTAAVGGVDHPRRGAPTTWVALVSWDASKLHAHVEIRRGSADAAVEAVRDVDFSETDDVAQRHRAVGLIIAAHVLGREREQNEQEAQAAAGPTPEPSAPTLAPHTTREDEEVITRHPLPRLGLDLALLAGPALDPGAPRFGLMLRGFVRPFDLPIAALLSLRAARRFEQPEVSFIGGSAGVLLRLQSPDSAFAVEARSELVVQRTHAHVQQGDEDATGGAWRVGGQLGLEAHLALSHSVWVFGGGELGLFAPTVHLSVAGRETGVERAFGWGALAGARYAH